MSEILNDTALVAKKLNEGLVGAIPTETVYGLAGNALDEKAVIKIFEAKKRPKFDPLICHVASLEQGKKWVVDFPEAAEKLAKAFWPGPLTLLLPKTEEIPDIVTSGSPLVGLRVPKHKQAIELLEQLDFPLAAPSANPFGYISPTSAKHVVDQLGEDIDFVLDGGDCEVGIESTVVGFENGEAVIYRLGGVAKEQVQFVVGKVRLSSTLEHPDLVQSPGQLKSHYAPKVPLKLGDFKFIENEKKKYKPSEVGIITFRKVLNEVPRENQKILSIQGDMSEAARRLFGAMRELDETPNLKVIFAQVFPKFGLGLAINDRLERASATE